MKNLSDFIAESEMSISSLNGYLNSFVSGDIFSMMDNAIDLYDGNLEDISVDNILDLVDLHSNWCFEHFDDNDKSKWLQVKPGRDEDVSTYILVGGTIYQLEDIESFKYKNDKKSVIYGITEDNEYFAISVPKLLKYLNDNKSNSIISPNGKSIEFNKDFLKEL